MKILAGSDRRLILARRKLRVNRRRDKDGKKATALQDKGKSPRF